MTMPNASHPDDERLAAYAGGDADATTDRALAAHISSCDRCAPIVDELTLLRGALAALPDLAPSRPLRLIPPVPVAVPRRAGPLSWLHRLAAPAMAAGAGLVLVGSVGLSGLVAGFNAAGADQTAMEHARASDNAAPAPGLGAASPVPSPETDPAFGSGDSPRAQTDGASASGQPSSRGDDGTSVAPAPSEPLASREEGEVTPFSGPREEQPWLTILIAGTALFAVSTVLRFSLTPRAG